MSKTGNRFVISDTHFGHTNAWEKFKLADGVTPLRPFTSTEEMDEAMVERWNATVSDNDTVYHLGDVVIARRNLETVKRLKGRKILIRGNHDLFKDKDYYEAGFESLRGCMVFTGKWIMTHIPIHVESLARFRVNVHGHLHGNQVMELNPNRAVHMNPETFEPTCVQNNPYDLTKTFPMEELKRPDPRYMSVCVEQTNFTPISFEELEARIQARWAEQGYTPSDTDGWGNGSGPG